MKHNNSINSMDNYKNDLDENEKIIFFKYINIIQDFIQSCLENIYIKNITYYKYIIINGIKMLNKIFNIILLYTNNLDTTYYHCSKSLFYYIEFISQIGDDGNAFLKLNSKDAYLFILKKTIFDLNEDHRKNFVENEKSTKINEIKDNYIHLYNNILFNIIDNYDLKYNDDTNIELLKLITKKLYKISELVIQIKNYNDHNESIEYFIQFILNYNYNLPYIELFLKKYNKKTSINVETVKKNCNHELIEQYYKDMIPTKFIQYIIT
jgi:hypothetical protein